MKAYKFRASAQFDLALDVILNQRLYCADWSRLNDPMEGAFAFLHDSEEELKCLSATIEAVRQERTKIRVCSLSLTFDCHLLWAHYASGFDGLAIEVDLPSNSRQVRKVRYRPVLHRFVDLKEKTSPKNLAEKIVGSKYREWHYEREVRILQNEEWFELPRPVTRVIAGHRMKPALLEALRIICQQKGVPLFRTRIDAVGIQPVPLPRLG